MSASQHIPKSSSTWRKWMPQCANPTCTTKGLFQTFAHRKHRLSVDGQWYCGQNCFEQAVKAKMEELMTSQGKPAKARSSRIPLGLLLLQRGILTAEQLKVALEQHRLTGTNFGDVVQQLAFATQEQVTAAVAAQWACPVFSLGEKRLEVQVRIPRQLLELYGMLPVHFSESESKLLIGFVSGVQHQVLYTIGHMTSCMVAPCFITAREYDLHLHSPLTTFLRDDEVVFDQIVETAEMARITTNHVMQFAAEGVRLGKCRDYLWVRILGPKLEKDLLFRVQTS
jgi:hypothetical protein